MGGISLSLTCRRTDGALQFDHRAFGVDRIGHRRLTEDSASESSTLKGICLNFVMIRLLSPTLTLF